MNRIAIVMLGLSLAWGCTHVTEETPAPAEVPTQLSATVSDSGTGTVTLPVIGVNYSIVFQPGKHGEVLYDASLGRYRYHANESFYGADTCAYAITLSESRKRTEGELHFTLRPGSCLPRLQNDFATGEIGLAVINIDVLANDDLCQRPVALSLESNTGPQWTVSPGQSTQRPIVLYTPPPGPPRADSAVYLVTTPAGVIRRGKVRVMVQPQSCQSRFRAYPDTFNVGFQADSFPRDYGFLPANQLLRNDTLCAEIRDAVAISVTGNSDFQQLTFDRRDRQNPLISFYLSQSGIAKLRSARALAFTYTITRPNLRPSSAEVRIVARR